MRLRFPGVVVGATALAGHAVAVGGYLESVFFLVALAWGWVAVTGLREDLRSAQAMVVTMAALLALAVLIVIMLEVKTTRLVAHLSLALIPGLVSWICMFIYIRFVRHQQEQLERAAANPAGRWILTDSRRAGTEMPLHQLIQARKSINDPDASGREKPEDANGPEVHRLIHPRGRDAA